jgi:hypothetical protein
MASQWTRTAAFRFFNTEPRNPNWSWSARSADGLAVVVTLWKDELIGPAGGMVYHRHDLGDWHKGNGSRLFFEDMAWALANCSGIVRVIVAIRDRNSGPRVRTAECYPQKQLFMRVTHLDPEMGAFRLEQVAPVATAESFRREGDPALLRQEPSSVAAS